RRRRRRSPRRRPDPLSSERAGRSDGGRETDARRDRRLPVSHAQALRLIRVAGARAGPAKDRRDLEMDRRLRFAAVMAACVMTLTFSAVAYAYVLTDMNDWNLSESLSTYGGGTQFHIASGTDGSVSFRWLDAPNKTTVISGNSCQDWSLIGSSS